jgi:hypothetical protein
VTVVETDEQTVVCHHDVVGLRHRHNGVLYLLGYGVTAGQTDLVTKVIAST